MLKRKNFNVKVLISSTVPIESRESKSAYRKWVSNKFEIHIKYQVQDAFRLCFFFYSQGKNKTFFLINDKR